MNKFPGVTLQDGFQFCLHDYKLIEVAFGQGRLVRQDPFRFDTRRVFLWAWTAAGW